MEQKRRGRPAKEKLMPTILETEVGEGTLIDKLKFCGNQLEELEEVLNKEPYRMDLRVKKQEFIDQICFLIKNI
jgi:hypothetical protein